MKAPLQPSCRTPKARRQSFSMRKPDLRDSGHGPDPCQRYVHLGQQPQCPDGESWCQLSLQLGRTGCRQILIAESTFNVQTHGLRFLYRSPFCFAARDPKAFPRQRDERIEERRNLLRCMSPEVAPSHLPACLLLCAASAAPNTPIAVAILQAAKAPVADLRSLHPDDPPIAKQDWRTRLVVWHRGNGTGSPANAGTIHQSGETAFAGRRT